MRILICTAILAFTGVASAATQSSYRVPTDEALKPLATFTIQDLEVQMRSDRTKIEYTLPLELTGIPNRIEVKGPAVVAGQPIVLEGGGATMKCPDDTLTECSVSYYAVRFDAAAREAFIRANHPVDEFEGRMQVASRFMHGGEPHGFLTVVDSQNE